MSAVPSVTARTVMPMVSDGWPPLCLLSLLHAAETREAGDSHEWNCVGWCYIMQAGLVGSSWPCKYLILPSGLLLYRQAFVSAESFVMVKGRTMGWIRGDIDDARARRAGRLASPVLMVAGSLIPGRMRFIHGWQDRDCCEE